MGKEMGCVHYRENTGYWNQALVVHPQERAERVPLIEAQSHQFVYVSNVSRPWYSEHHEHDRRLLRWCEKEDRGAPWVAERSTIQNDLRAIEEG